MNIFQARQISITAFLDYLNIERVHIRGGVQNYKIDSPINHSSKLIKVLPGYRIWADDKGNSGDIIDLAIFLWGTTREATIKRLLKIGNTIKSKEISTQDTFQERIFASNNSLNNLVIRNYFSEEIVNLLIKHFKISVKVAKQFCFQVEFSIGKHRISGLGFQNRSGGFSIKSSINTWYSGPQDITYIQHKSKLVSIFTDFIDFLTMRYMNLCAFETSSYIVLHNQSVDDIVKIMSEYSYIHLYLSKGDKSSVNTLNELNLGAQLIDKSYLYKGEKSLNEAHRKSSNKPQQKESNNNMDMSLF